MIRLVTQFDQPSARPAAATPTCSCGCSSCCCCCIVTAVAATIYTAVSPQRVYRRMQVEAPERIPLGWPLPALIGFFSLPVSLAVIWIMSALLLSVDAGGALAFGLAAWIGMVGLAYRAAGHAHPWWRAVAVVVICVVAFVVEFFVWLSAIEVE